MKLSIILPIYNVAQYLEKCIRSIENQKIPKYEFEIVCVNDGSPDHSRQIVEKLQLEFSNIVLINQANKGVSVARNNGIKAAKGDYIMFIDPDDYLYENSLRDKLNLTLKYQLDVGVCSFTILNFQNEKVYDFVVNSKLNSPESGINYFDKYIKGKSEIMNPDRSVAIFFNRDFFMKNNLFYTPNVPYLEDGELLYKIYSLAQKVLFLPGEFYARTTREGSAMNSNLFYNEVAINGFLYAAKSLRRFQQKFNKSSKEYNFINQPIAKFLFLYLTGSKRFWFFNEYFRSKNIKKDFDFIGFEGNNPFYYRFAKYYNSSLAYFYFRYVTYNIIASIKVKFSK